LKAKLDENFGNRAIDLFRESGHEVSTVFDQNLGGTGDEDLIETCRTAGRVLVTLDLDFSNVLRFPPREYAGIVSAVPPSPDGDGGYPSAHTRTVASSGRRGSIRPALDRGAGSDTRVRSRVKRFACQISYP